MKANIQITTEIDEGTSKEQILDYYGKEMERFLREKTGDAFFKGNTADIIVEVIE